MADVGGIIRRLAVSSRMAGRGFVVVVVVVILFVRWMIQCNYDPWLAGST